MTKAIATIALLAAMAGPCLAQDDINWGYTYYQRCHSFSNAGIHFATTRAISIKEL